MTVSTIDTDAVATYSSTSRYDIIMVYSCYQDHTFWGDDQPAPLAGSSVDHLHNVDEFLLVRHRPVDLVIVSRAQVNHDVLVAEEEHDRAGVVELVHRIEGWHLHRRARDLVTPKKKYIALKAGTCTCVHVNW